ncbi:MAG: hypothetical protein UR93_C0024G0010 [Berkelbacteria bacterium GW2011_GWA2_35_9]|uniref:Uncharacterized protein n=1 Tax=Berkelbacteria bacterium GW2011_GWA2_35_9 TaxID=1618333 RepID=A0A0G0FKT3_9BACT|nr:MAG: hypothetical protein UR93_C0024G0010 [Berkelbacteria bacterium GW2011_GWA2_35_9]
MGYLLLVIVLLVVLKLVFYIVPKSGADIAPPTFPPVTVPIANPVFTLQKGWNLIAQPGKYYQDPNGPIYTPAAPGFNFYQPHTDIFSWDALQKKYIDLDKNQKITQPGEGFWIYSDNNESFSLDGGYKYYTINNSKFKITLQPGWNQVGNPFNESIDIQKIKVIIDPCPTTDDPIRCMSPAETKSYADARKSGDVSSFYTFDGKFQEWVTFSENSFPFKIGGGCPNPIYDICLDDPIPDSLRGIMPAKMGAFIYNYKTFPVKLNFVSGKTNFTQGKKGKIGCLTQKALPGEDMVSAVCALGLIADDNMQYNIKLTDTSKRYDTGRDEEVTVIGLISETINDQHFPYPTINMTDILDSNGKSILRNFGE